MVKPGFRIGIVAMLTCLSCTALESAAEWIPQVRTARGVARTEGPALAELRMSLGIATEYVYGLPFDPDLSAIPERLPRADESPYLPDLYRALWGPGYENKRAGPLRGDTEHDERRQFLEEYHDAIATEGDPICCRGSHRCGRCSEPLSWLHWFN